MLKVELDGPVLRIILNRPEVRNAFNEELICALRDAFENLPEGTRAVIVSGEGDAFCAGGDLNWMHRAANYTEERNFQDALNLSRLFQAVCDCPAATIARVHGPCFGGGCGIVAACDIVLASDTARFAFSEVRLGLVPATISPFVLKKIGVSAARALFTTGEAFGAQRALEIGLAHYTGTINEIDEELGRKLKAILASGPVAVAAAKGLAQQPPMSQEESARLLARFRTTDEAREGVTAFLEKRRPTYAVDPG